jgi:hypothetical protein
MSDLRLRARSVTEIVDAAFQLYKRDALEYVLVTAVAYAPWVVAQLLVLRSFTVLGPARLGVPASASLILAVVGIFAYALMSAALSRFASDVYLERPTSLTTVMRAVLPTVPPVIGATFLLGLVLVLGFIPTMVGAAISSVPLIFIGVVLSIAWALYVFARFFAVFQVIVLEGRDVIAAFARSGVLSRNLKGHILLTLFLVFVIFIVLSIAVTMVAGLVGSNAGTVVLQALYTVVAYPLIGITQMILYYDARIRSEGFDIEMMTGALGTPAAGSAS